MGMANQGTGLSIDIVASPLIIKSSFVGVFFILFYYLVYKLIEISFFCRFTMIVIA